MSVPEGQPLFRWKVKEVVPPPEIRKALSWWETHHKRSLPKIVQYVEGSFPAKTHASWEKQANSIVLFPPFFEYNTQDQIMTLFHELGHCLEGHHGKEGHDIKKEKEAERLAVLDSLDYLGHFEFRPYPDIPRSFYEKLFKEYYRKQSKKPPKSHIPSGIIPPRIIPKPGD